MPGRLRRLLSEFLGAEARFLLEQATEILRIFETQGVGDLPYRMARAEQQLLSLVDEGQVDVFEGAFPRTAFEEITEVVGGHL